VQLKCQSRFRNVIDRDSGCSRLSLVAERAERVDRETELGSTEGSGSVEDMTIKKWRLMRKRSRDIVRVNFDKGCVESYYDICFDTRNG